MLVFAMLFSCMGVFAEEPEVEGNDDYTITFSADEITDVSTLTEMIKSGKNRVSIPKQSVYAKSNFENDNTVYQLLTEKLYRNGDVEREYVSTTLITRATINNNSVSDSIASGSSVISHRFYYSWYNEGGITGTNFIKPTKIVTRLAQKGINDSVSFRHMYNVSWQGGVYELEREQRISAPGANIDYPLAVIAQNGISPTYVSSNSGVVSIYSGVEFTVNGKTNEIKVYPLSFF